MAPSRLTKLLRWTALLLLAAFLSLQLKQADRTNPPVLMEIAAPAEIAAILERSCYNCHSNETDWPWYAYVSPLSWWIVDHVDHARRDMNFSDWPLLDRDAQAHAFHEIDEEIAEDEMPLPKYLILHPEARLSDEDKETLRAWARSNF